MNRLNLIFSLLFIVSSVCYSQTSTYKTAFVLRGGVNQYDGDLGSEAFQAGTGTYHAGFGFRQYINPFLGAGFDIGLGNLDFQKDFDRDFVDVDLLAEFKIYNGLLLSEDAKFRPYLTAGIGVNTILDDGWSFPVGAGFRYRFNDDFALQLASIYKYSLTEQNPSYLQTTLGLLVNISDRSDAEPTPAVIDTDGDGINDPLDKCPTEAGPQSNDGCPVNDVDGDGIPDEEDECPNIAGVAEFNGCPDSDGDGIKDSEDACPKDAGTAANNGCPDSDGDGVIDKEDDCPNVAGPINGCPDRDSDGVKDSEDVCPDEAGIKSNKGCPEIEEEVKKVLAQALTGIQFETGKSVIKRVSYPILDNVVSVMKQHPEYKLEIKGHTDNTGNADSNMRLSDARAKAARQYLIDKGIDASRMTAQGFGITQPIADNNTRAGRAKNRRVEFKVVF